jgi:membrane associated rhomboid family serine protease
MCPSGGTPRVRRCPTCGLALQPLTHAGVTVDVCLECRGIWLCAERLRDVIGASASGIVSPLAARQARTTRRQCPAGHGALQAASAGSGVEVDSCPECLGVWFDGGEVARVRQVVRAAGPSGTARDDALDARADELEREVEDQHAVLKQEHVETPTGTWLFQWLSDLPQEVYSPVGSRPLVTYGLIAACVVVFVLQVWSAIQWTTAGMLIDRWGLIPATFFQGTAPWTLVTSMFMHGDPYHLAGNAYFLWVFGDNVEDRVGRGRYLALYLLGGVAGAAAHIASDPRSTIPVVGASGAISALAGAYVYLFPDRRFYLMIFDFWLARVRAVWVLGVWVVLQVVFALLDVAGVAWWAHIGGFVFGVGAAVIYRIRLAARIATLEHTS